MRSQIGVLPEYYTSSPTETAALLATKRAMHGFRWQAIYLCLVSGLIHHVE